MNPHDILLRKLKEHTQLSSRETEAIRSLPAKVRKVGPQDDIVRQGDKPDVSVVVLSGMVGRYHTLDGGARQYLSFHIMGDMPDAQALFIERMDHSVCAISPAVIATIRHTHLLELFERIPTIGLSIWRETLIDAAIFRETITNNSSRDVPVRLAHFLCEQFYRARAVGLVKDGCCDLPLSQTQIAEALGSSLTSISRAMQRLRKEAAIDAGNGKLCIKNWNLVSSFCQFDPTYLHLRRPLKISSPALP